MCSSKRASAGVSDGSNVKPFSPLRRRSGTQPQAFDTSTGTPEAMASLTTSPQGSRLLGSTKQPAKA